MSLLAATGALLAAVVQPQTSAAPTLAEIPRRHEMNAAEVFAVADTLAREGRYAEAETLLLALTQDASLDYRSEARFRLGRLRQAQGDAAGALRWYRALLAENPGAAVVRIEVARLLSATGENRAAVRELRRARATSDLPSDVARLADRFALGLRSQRRLGASVELALAPDSNINRATGGGEIDTVLGPLLPDEDARATSDVGLSLTAAGFWRSGGATVPLLARLSGRGDLYRQSQFNDVALTAAVGPEFTKGQDRYRPSALYVRRWFGGEGFSRHIGGSLAWLHAMNAAARIEVEATILRGAYARLPRQNGFLYDLGLAYDIALSPGLSMRGSLRGSRASARDPGYSTAGASVGGLIARRTGGQTFFAELNVGALAADERLSLFPERRRDLRIDIGGGVLLDRVKIGSLSPLLRVRHTANRSTVDVYQFRRTRFEFGLGREF